MPRGHVFLKTVAAGLVLAAAVGQIQAQDAAADVQVRRISDIMKSKVVIQDNQQVGLIVVVVYNDGGWIDYFVADYDNQQYVVPFEAVQYRAADRIAFIDIAPAQFRQVSFFAPNRFPNIYAPNFRSQVFTSFNIRSGGNARSRSTFRQGTDVNVNGRDRDRDGNARDRDVNTRDRDRNANDRNPADRDRDSVTDRNRPNRDPNADRPNATDRDRSENRPAPPADRPERNPSTNPPISSDRDNPPPARPGAGTNPDRGGNNPPPANVKPETVPGAGSNPPSSNKPTPPPTAPDKDKKPLPAPPVVPK